MTIERGAAWGAPAVDVVGAASPATARSDAEVASLAAGGTTVIELDRFDGDLARTLGLERSRPEAERIAYPFDLGLVELDDGPAVPFVAGVVAHRRLWRGEFAIVANCGWWGDRYVGPRAHPNDGVLDVTVGSLRPGQRVLAARRIRSGTHLPHPDLRALRTSDWEHRFSAPVRVSADRRSVGRARSLRVSMRVDCFTLIV